MRCPYCNSELLGNMTTPYCPNPNCNYWSFPMSSEIWCDLIAGKKAQRKLRTVKDRCVKKVKAKEREIANCLNGISVRQGESERLAKQLKQAQDALSEIKHYNENIKSVISQDWSTTAEIIWTNCVDIDNQIATITKQDTKE